MNMVVVALASVLAAPSPSSREKGLRVSGYTVLGLGLVSLAGSIVSTAVSVKARNRYFDPGESATGFTPESYAPKYRTLDRRADQARLATFILLGTGLGLVHVAPVLIGLADAHKRRRLAFSVDAGRRRVGLAVVGTF